MVSQGLQPLIIHGLKQVSDGNSCLLFQYQKLHTIITILDKQDEPNTKQYMRSNLTNFTLSSIDSLP